MSYACDEYGDPYFRIQRQPDITFSASDPKVVARLQKQFAKGEKLHVNIMGWRGACYVIKLDYTYPIDGVVQVNAVLRPTGRPTSRGDALKLDTRNLESIGTYGAPAQKFATTVHHHGIDYGTQPGRVVVTGLPTPPAGTIAQRIYGKSFTQTIIDELAKATGIEARKLMADVKGRVPIYSGALRDSIMDDMLLNGHPNCRCTPVGITTKERPVKIRNKYYVAAPSVTTHSEQDQDNTAKAVHLSTSPNDRSGKWTRHDLKDAIKHAEQMLDADPNKDHVTVVKIIRVVRRRKAPVVVEVIK